MTYRRYAKKNRNRRKRPKKNRRLDILINRGPSLVPDAYCTTMVYASEYQAGTADIRDLTLTSFSVSGNSIYDPDETRIGQYPAGYAEMRALYKHFYVSASSLEVEAIVNSPTAQLNSARMAIWRSLEAEPALSSFNDVVTNPNCGQIIYIGPNVGRSVARLRSSSTTKSMFGFNTKVERAYHGEMTKFGEQGDPPKQWFYHIYHDNVSAGAQTPPDIKVTFRVKYKVMLYNRRLQVRNSLSEVEIGNHDPATQSVDIDKINDSSALDPETDNT